LFRRIGKMAQDVLWLSQADVESLEISMKKVIEAVELGWRLKGEGKVEMPAKIGIHPRKDCYIHAMPCWIGGEIDACGEKWVSGFPMNIEKRIPYNIGLLILTDSNDGHMKAVMDANWITTWRTGAASAVISKYLADPKSSKLAIIGAGTQGCINAHALKVQFPGIKTVSVYDVAPAQMEKFGQSLKNLFSDLTIITTKTIEETCNNADIVITCCPVLEKPQRFVKSLYLKKDVLCIAVDHDSAFDSDVMTEAVVYVVDDRNQYKYMQSGGIYFQGYPAEHELYAEMSEMVVGKRQAVFQGRRTATPMGIACNDIMVANIVYAKALERKVGVFVKH
jgi:ornithine cyclodeaminase/alanine dehydrogenase